MNEYMANQLRCLTAYHELSSQAPQLSLGYFSPLIDFRFFVANIGKSGSLQNLLVHMNSIHLSPSKSRYQYIWETEMGCFEEKAV